MLIFRWIFSSTIHVDKNSIIIGSLSLEQTLHERGAFLLSFKLSASSRRKICILPHSIFFFSAAQLRWSSACKFFQWMNNLSHPWFNKFLINWRFYWEINEEEEVEEIQNFQLIQEIPRRFWAVSSCCIYLNSIIIVLLLKCKWKFPALAPPITKVTTWLHFHFIKY